MSAVATLTRAVVVPDPAWWAAAGVDLRAAGFEPAGEPRRADALVVPERLPESLGEAVDEARLRLPDPGRVEVVGGLELPGEPVAELLGSAAAPAERQYGEAEDREDEHHGHGREDEHEQEGHGDGHHGMMEVTGEPSDDGLVMEDSEVTIGPVSAAALPTGLVVDVRLDGDVICSAKLSSLLPPLSVGGADPLSPMVCRWAIERGGGGPPQAPALTARRLAAVEVERALSHATWLARFAGLLGWGAAAVRIERSLTPLIAAQRRFLQDRERMEIGDCDELTEALASLAGSRRLAWRTEGLAMVDEERCREAGARGPIARAAGLDADSRALDPAYQALDFAPITRSAGDALARAGLRAEEALASLELARAALEAGALPADGAAAEVEGPRGPLEVSSGGPGGAPVLLAVGADAACELASAAALGQELAQALAALASFDLGPGGAGR